MEDPGANSPFDFTNGDAITIEAWVKLDDFKAGENFYIIGKGRTGAANFPRDNQNWAMRIRESGGKACINFLFASKPAAGVAKSDAHWHRWTSNTGFSRNTGWHHVAVSYKFGEPKTIKGWIDGNALPGKWDMGGETTDAPVVDEDAIWIGASQGGTANSFRGLLDGIAIHREVLADSVMKSRFKRVGGEVVAKPAPEIMPEVGPIPAGKVLATFHEGLAAHNRWLNVDEKVPPETARWAANETLLHRLPFRYDAWGVRDSWDAPVLARLAADVTLTPGERKFVIRTRGLARLWVNGQVVVRNKTISGSTDGHQPVSPIPQPPLPGVRAVGYEMQESFGDAIVPPDGKCRIILETIVGGEKFRAEPGEALVAVLSPDGKAYSLLSSSAVDQSPIPLTDAAVEDRLAAAEKSLEVVDEVTRCTAAATMDAFWQKRHEAATAWAKQNPGPTPAAGGHPIDGFIKAKIDRAIAESSAVTPQTKQFHAEVLPLLNEQCFRCHGEKEKGGLRLNTREAALKAGESEKPAVVPGDVSASELIARIKSKEEDVRMPPQGKGLTEKQVATLEAWIKNGAAWPAPPISPEQVAVPPVVDDAAFLRRAYFDTVGVPPTEAELRAFLTDGSSDKRAKAIDKLLADPRWADHWVSYWQDVLAENPNMLKPSLNNTGPFRWFLHESLTDNKPMDRMVTELILLRGSEREGGAAGFGLAADNDAPFAAKGHIIGEAFLGIELQCARCHDSPYHSTKQQDLYALAAMFERKTVSVPKSSTVPAAFFEKKARESLIKVTLKPGEPIKPIWPFAAATGRTDDESLDAMMIKPTDTRERLAALITTPQNKRFAQVIANRIWRKLMGAGIVEPAHDWEGHAASHPDMLEWLAREFVAGGYDLRQLQRTIMTSQAYQRQSTGHNLTAVPEKRFFNAPERRRLTAEQVVDSLFAVSGQPIETEEITFDPDARRPANTMISLGYPKRAWEFASLSNERDRPSLSLPRAQAVTDVLEAFGWTGSRQSPRTDRETDPNVLQPGVLANSIVSVWTTRAAMGSGIAELAVKAESPETLAEALFLRVLGRQPTAAEKAPLVEALSEGFSTRLTPASAIKMPEPPPPLSRVTWSNHLVSEANVIKVEMEQRARTGPPADPRLQKQWRETYEDVVWTLVNNREFVWMP
ncbi:DUF1553 domain-containing protein [Humisphaera borealis]|uniref:DUF1553 domain-containing protein n=2 Tax=Humisphaera borealis TaxID=2807512 RepID=A0A7M2X4B2_9BACT|nr:DUF1553 domain-containing protein [Humisphaera borealis]